MYKRQSRHQGGHKVQAKPIVDDGCRTERGSEGDDICVKEQRVDGYSLCIRLKPRILFDK